MGKKLKKLVYFFLKYHCPTAAQEFYKSLKLIFDDAPETTLENIYIDWKRLKSMKDDKSTQANLDLPENKVITRQIQKKKVCKPVKSIPDDATQILSKASKPFESGTESCLKSKNKETKPVQSNLENIINKMPAQFNGFIPRPVLHGNTLTKVADADGAEGFNKYDTVIDIVVNRAYIKSQPISTNIKSPTKKAQVPKEKDVSSLAGIKEKFQKGLNKSFVKDTKTAPLADENQKPLPTKNDIANNEETKNLETKVPPKKKVKKDKINDLLENCQVISDENNEKQSIINDLENDNTQNKVQPDGGVMEVFSPLKSEKKKKGRGKDDSKKNEIQNGESAKKMKKLEAEPAPTPDLLKHPVTNDFSAQNGFNSSSNAALSNSFVNNLDSESPELQGVRMSKPFRRVSVYGDIKIDPKLNNNSFEAMKGATNSWGEKANDVLKFTKGKSFKHEKTKKKRGNYSGGAITLGVNSVQFSDVDD